MAVTYGFYNSLAGDRKYDALQVSRIFEGIITEGVFATVGQNLAISANPGTMTINVGTGRAWLNNTWTLNDSNLVLTVQASEAVLHRIDAVVLESNSDIGTRANSIKIIKGTPAGSPVAPTMANTATLKQFRLANIAVAPGVTQIVAGNITNFIGTASTPYITNAVSNINVASMFGQLESNFQAWFDNLVDQLDGVQVTNLQNQINVLSATNNFGWLPVTDTWTFNTAAVANIPSDGTLKYQKWMRVRLKQGGAFKYFVVNAVSATTLGLYGGADYSLANSTITDISYSYEDKPFGFPDEFSFALSLVNFTIGNATVVSRVGASAQGRITGFVSLAFGTTSSISGAIQLNLPLPTSSLYPLHGGTYQIGVVKVRDVGAAYYSGQILNSGALMIETASGTYVGETAITATVPMTWVSGDGLSILFDYQSS